MRCSSSVVVGHAGCFYRAPVAAVKSFQLIWILAQDVHGDIMGTGNLASVSIHPYGEILAAKATSSFGETTSCCLEGMMKTTGRQRAPMRLGPLLNRCVRSCPRLKWSHMSRLPTHWTKCRGMSWMYVDILCAMESHGKAPESNVAPLAVTSSESRNGELLCSTTD